MADVQVAVAVLPWVSLLPIFLKGALWAHPPKGALCGAPIGAPQRGQGRVDIIRNVLTLTESPTEWVNRVGGLRAAL